MDAAEALDQRRLAGAVVAEQREDLAVHSTEMTSRAMTAPNRLVAPRTESAGILCRAADRGVGERSSVPHRCATAPDSRSRRAARRSRPPQDDQADRDQLVERVDIEQVQPLRMTPIMNAPTMALPTCPGRPEAAPPMITAAIESSSASCPKWASPRCCGLT